jgi:hypothetical protein
VKCKTYLTFEEMEMDHDPARSKGGSDNLSTLRTMCGPFKNGCHRGGKDAKHK